MKKDIKGLKEAKNLLIKAKRGDVQSLAQLLSLIESDLGASVGWLSSLKADRKSHRAIRIGITGPPGAGKSTLINLLIQNFRASKKKVGIIAIDPSSPYSGGALLGDRIRMNHFASDKKVFIRSIGSRGAFGGLSASAGAMARIFDQCAFDILIIETVGVGQTELQIMNLADVTAVVLVPESGDVVQTLKAGILEIADAFVVNKADRPGADLLARELESLVEQEGLERRCIFLTSALSNIGVKELSAKLFVLGETVQKDDKRRALKARGELHSLIMSSINQDLQSILKDLKVNDAYKAFGEFHIPHISARSLKKV